MTVRVLTVDDQPIFLEAVRALVASTPGFELAGEATSGADAIRAAAVLEPDLVLMDVRMPGLDGIETTQMLKTGSKEPVVILVSGHDFEDAEAIAQQAGAVAVVLKERLRPRLLRSLWAEHGSAVRGAS
jgi:DNA-binding NarL/FixJ family response regulator